MEKTLEVLNEMEAASVVRRYAIGGAVGAIFYMEPFLTFDLDVFVDLPMPAAGLISLSPVYEYLRKRGYLAEGEVVNVEGVPVQFLPLYNPLVTEAVKEAREMTYGPVRTRVLRPEHLAALMVQTGREKDRQRLEAFAREVTLNREYLDGILSRYALRDKWEQWTRPEN